MSDIHTDLERLEKARDHIQTMVRFSQLYGGKIELAGKYYYTAELNDFLEQIKYDIALIEQGEEEEQILRSKKVLTLLKL